MTNVIDFVYLCSATLLKYLLVHSSFLAESLGFWVYGTCKPWTFAALFHFFFLPPYGLALLTRNEISEVVVAFVSHSDIRCFTVSRR